MAFEPTETQYLFDAPRPLNSLASDFIQQYRAKRHLRELSDSALDLRSNDIVSNLMVLGTDGKYRPQFNIREDGLYAPVRNLDFMRMAVDVWEEYRLRERLHSPGHDRTGLALAERLADESWCRRADWEEGSRLSKDRYEKPRMLFRFSEKPEWNHSFLERGSFYVRPASVYGDRSLDNARQDDELAITWFDEALQPRVYRASNYYCMCFASTYDYRLFRDFNATSCVAIADPGELGNRIRRAIEIHNARNNDHKIQSLQACPMLYVDPFSMRPPTHAMEVQFVKHFRYAYQAEYRFVLDSAAGKPLQAFFLEMGSLCDIASIVEMP